MGVSGLSERPKRAKRPNKPKTPTHKRHGRPIRPDKSKGQGSAKAQKVFSPMTSTIAATLPSLRFLPMLSINVGGSVDDEDFGDVGHFASFFAL